MLIHVDKTKRILSYKTVKLQKRSTAERLERDGLIERINSDGYWHSHVFGIATGASFVTCALSGPSYKLEPAGDGPLNKALYSIKHP